MRQSFLLLLLLWTNFAFGIQTLQIKIQEKSGNRTFALEYAKVDFNGKRYYSDNKGNVLLKDIKQGEYTLKVNYIGFKEYKTTVKIPYNKPYFTVNMQVNNVSLHEIVCTCSPYHTSDYQVADILSKRDIERQAGASLSKILSSVQGVSTIQTGATIGKPVIHGLHSNRIVILNNGVRQEGQSWGSDHAPEIDPDMAEKITVLKQADAIRYGSDALGGVVVIAPQHLPYGRKLHGKAGTTFSSNGRKSTAKITLQGSLPQLSQWAWRLQGSAKRAGDFHTADYVLNNTGFKELNFSVATGLKVKSWKTELFYSRYDNEAGVFYGSHIGNLEDLLARFQVGRPTVTLPFTFTINAPKQWVVHDLLKAKTNGNVLSGTLSLQYAYQNDVRKEFSVRRLDRTKTPALNMTLSTHSVDINWKKEYAKGVSELGANAQEQVNYNAQGTGVVPIIPNYASMSYGLFFIQKNDFGKFKTELGIRYDYKYLSADGYNSYSQRYGGTHSFENTTYSVGTSYKFNPYFSLKSNLGVAWRAPHVNELYSSGLHHGAGTYDLGNENLKSERGVKWITSLNYNKASFRIKADVFAQIIKNYIYDFPTGETRTLFSGVYPIFHYTQADAFFRGFDVKMDYSILPNLEYGIQMSAVYANKLKTSEYFPFIPSERVSQKLAFKPSNIPFGKGWYFSVNHKFTAKQTRYNKEKELVATTPDAYNLVGLEMGAKFRPMGKGTLSVDISAENIFNKLYKEYTNRFRYYAHDMGRNIQINLHYNF